MKQYHLDLLKAKNIANDITILSGFPELAGRVMPLKHYILKVPGCKECGWGRDMYNTITNELKNNPSFLTKFLQAFQVDQVRYMKDNRMIVLPTPPKA